VDVVSENYDGDGLKASDSTVTFRQIYTSYDNDIVLEVGARHLEYRTPFLFVGRQSTGYLSNGWHGRLSWYFIPEFQFGLGHVAESRTYRSTRNDSSYNQLSVFGEWSYSEAFSVSAEFAASHEIVDVGGMRDYKDNGLSATLSLKTRY